MDAKNFAFVLIATEYERGWGSRPDGYVCFKTEADADAFLKKDEERKKATKDVPDEYTDFTKYGYKAVKESVVEALETKEFYWRDRRAEIFEE